jgi:hypothetical protein
MAHAVSLKDTTANAMLDAITTAIGSNGKLRIYDGTQPATADTALSGNNVLADLALSATFAAGAASGVLTADTITADSSADATGTASFFSLLTSGNVRILDGTVGTSGADLNLNTTSIVSGASVAVSSLTITIS